MIIAAFILGSIAYMTEISIYINNGNAKYKS